MCVCVPTNLGTQLYSMCSYAAKQVRDELLPRREREMGPQDWMVKRTQRVRYGENDLERGVRVITLATKHYSLPRSPWLCL